MRIKKISMMEMVVTVLLFFMILAALRFMVVDMMEFSNQINHNTSSLNTMQNSIMTLNEDLKKSYKVEILEKSLIAHTLEEIITFEIKENVLYKNEVKLLKLGDIEMNFEDATLESNLGNGVKVVKVNFSYLQISNSEEVLIHYSRYIGTLE